MKVSHWPNPICTRTTLYCPTRPGHRAGATTITHSLEDTVATETAIWRCDHCGTRYTNAQLDKRAGQCVCSSYDLTDDDGAVIICQVIRATDALTGAFVQLRICVSRSAMITTPNGSFGCHGVLQ